MSLVEIDWHPDAKVLRRFGAGMLILGPIAAALLYAKDLPTAALVLLVFSVVAGALGLTGTRAGLPIYWFWMGISFVLGMIVSPIVFGLFYYGLVTPIALCMRLVGRDRLWRRKPQTETFWRDVEDVQDPSRYERQF